MDKVRNCFEENLECRKEDLKKKAQMKPHEKPDEAKQAGRDKPESVEDQA